LDSNVIAGDAQISKHQHGSIRRGSVPSVELDVRGLARLLQRIKTLRDQVENSGVVQVIPERVVECLKEVWILGVVSRRLEIRDSQPDFFYRQAGARADPILLRETRKNQQKQEEQPQKRLEIRPGLG
jgi:hypothetical protein